jgi:DEAD/DEAH box helicase domain-containing protein
MLDYLLLRPQDAVIWAKNDPETLQFLVVDELHTFDGAQGTDLACLIRRLKDRLGTPENSLCCVGTSATLGSDSEATNLLSYAEKIFGEPFSKRSLITESRLSAGEFLGNAMISFIHPPERDDEFQLNPESYDSKTGYLAAQYRLWFDEEITESHLADPTWRIKLGESLKSHLLFQNLVKALKGGVLSFHDAWQEISISMKDRGDYSAYSEMVLISLVSLVSLARSENDRPFVQVRIQHWMRELGRMVVSTGKKPTLKFSDDLRDVDRKYHLPVIHCRECGAMGWLGTKKKHEDVVGHDLKAIYQHFFSKKDGNRFFVFPEMGDLQKAGLKGQPASFCGSCHHLSAKSGEDTCMHCGDDELVTVLIPENHTQTCPYCNAHKSLTLLGSRAASLASVMISQLYASPFNDDKKLITFSDNVQDAAHRAGFFGARTWGFNLRTAIQKAVDEAPEGITLSELPEFFIKFWKGRLPETEYITTFIAPNMEWFYDYDHLIEKGSLPDRSDLVWQIDSRLRWEILSEYGFDSRIGRTLEKSGCSAAHIDPAVLEAACHDLSIRLKNEVEICRDLDETQVKRFIIGMMTTLRINGAIEADFFKTYLESWGNQFLISQSHIRWMQSFGPSTRAPKFLTDRLELKNSNKIVRFDGLYQPSRRTFCTVWAEKNLLPQLALEARELRDVLEISVNSLIKGGILHERQQGGSRIWGIRPEVLCITRDVAQMQCGDCGHKMSVAVQDLDAWTGAPCLRTSCLGSYGLLSDTPDYYGRLYLHGDIERLFTKEHTGLLDRDTRERVEREFKTANHERKPWYPNLLSCTPTLEMGIDIGDLSATIQCSVPPAPTNYLQRIGRAGRKNGNALNLTLSSIRPHDLYFFADPLQMIAGKIEPPGVFLDAAAVLERQFTAFCFDRWVKKGVGQSDLPRKMGIILDSIIGKKQNHFPWTLLNFVELNQTVLFDDFQKLFKNPSLSLLAVTHLSGFIKGDSDKDDGSLGFKIIRGLTRLSEERKSLSTRIRKLRKDITDKEANPAKSKDHEDMLREMKQEKNGLQELVRNMNSKDVFNFFTDEGLLPNYAFPEQGVTLHSIIYRYKKEVADGEKKYDTTSYEYERAASSALGELAPSNTFYAGGRKVTVDQIDLQLSQLESWRFCADCSYAEMAGKKEPSPVCPRCGNTMWADAGRQLQMIRLRQVFATTPDSQSRIADDRDERDPQFYVKQLLMDYEPGDITEAYRLSADDAVFGYEYLSRADFREINFGHAGDEGTNFRVAGEENSRPGFTICRHCGKVPDRKGKLQHTWTCKYKNSDSAGNAMECAYLYRDFSSEAVKILLPITGLEGSDVRLQSFIASFHLGLKKQFGGSIDHLRSMLHTEPVPESNYRKQFLVIYDTVPGGTGYLKQLTGSQMLMDVLQIALDEILKCACASVPDKDGCYACLYGYRNSHSMSAISRKTAVSMLSEILKDRDSLSKTPNLSSVSLGPLFDSDLEARFIEALRRQNTPDCPVTLIKEIVDASPGFLLSIHGRRWRIAQQVVLDHKLGISETSRADFVFYPVRTEPGVKPIVVFTDGYSFHRNRIGKDMAQRMAIVRSKQFHVWSLTFKDVEDVFKSKPKYFDDWFVPGGMLSHGLFQKMWDGFLLSEEPKLEDKSSFQMFFRYLSTPSPLIWQKMALICSIGFLDKPQEEFPPSWEKALDAMPHSFGDDIQGRLNPCLGGGPDLRHFPAVTVYARTEQKALQKADISGVGFLAILDDGDQPIGNVDFEAAWNGFLRAYNLFQFLPHTAFITERGLVDHCYDTISSVDQDEIQASSENPSAFDNAWKELKELVLSDVLPLIDYMQNKGLIVPEAGMEIEKYGEVIGEIELAWAEKRVAVIKTDYAHLKPGLESDGWTCLDLEMVIVNPELIVSILV